MPSLSTILSLTLLVAARVRGLPDPRVGGQNTAQSGLAPRADQIQTLGHDKIRAMPQLVPAGINGTIYVTYQPLLRVKNGCVPFPVVDEEGKIGRGLKASGEQDGGGSKCNKSPGQTYVRSAPVGDYFALFYMWYQPKDQTGTDTGFRHDFEGVIVLLKDRNDTSAPNVHAVCPSDRGKYACKTAFDLQGTSPLVVYGNQAKVKGTEKQHSIYLTNNAGKKHTLVAWESMPEVARQSLSNYKFARQEVPIIDANFQKYLLRATPPAPYVLTSPHDRIAAIPQSTPEGMNGTLYVTYQPRLQVTHGCVPYPAVDSNGFVGEGLKPTGPSGGKHSKCHKSIGQVYVRSAWVGKYFALLYTWYQPKDQRGRHGKRNDWEGVLVLLKSRYVTDGSNIFAVCPSQSGQWTCSTDFSLDGTYPLIEYGVRGKSNDNTCYLSTEKGQHSEIVAWESMPRWPKDSLNIFDFGQSKVPFIDANFNDTLTLATPPA